jgi:hypothetical protein
MIFLFPASGSNPQERADVVESITPSTAMLFMKTARIKDLLESMNFVANNLLPQSLFDTINKKKDDFKNKTGIDLLDIESLNKTGVDTERTVSLALYPSGRRDENRIVLFIPVKNEKTFPLKFVEILKKATGSETLDLYPVITEYRSHTIYQIQKDIFSTAFDGVFILASTGELVRSIIDVKESNSGYLSLDPKYIDYLGKTKKNYDIRAFATRDFFKWAVSSMRMPRDRIREEKKKAEPNKDKQAFGPKTLNAARLFNVQHTPEAGADKEGLKKSESDKFFKGPSQFNAVDYVSLGAAVRPTDIDIDLAIQFNNTSSGVNTFLELIKTGLSDRALYVKNAATFAYVSIDCNKIEELCRTRGAGCAYYAEFKDEIRNELGIDFEREFIPFYSGVVNIIASQPKGSGGGYVLYFSMIDPAHNKVMWDKIAAYLKEKFKNTDRFGYEKIGAADSFWYIDSKNSKIYFVYDTRGMYIGNDTELVNTALSSKTIKEAPPGDDIIQKLGNNVFFLSFIKKESFFGALIMLQAFRNKELSAIVEKMTDIYVIGEKIDSYISLDITVKLMKRK